MDALVMCGGKGTRLEVDVEKPLFEVSGRPMVDRVLDALDASDVDTAYAVVSPHTPETRAHVDCPTVDAPGDGYVDDLGHALGCVDPPVLTVVADLPLLSERLIDRLVGAKRQGSLTVAVPAGLKELLGVSVDTTMTVDGRTLAPTGLNVVGDDDATAEETRVSFDARLAVNVNRVADARVAERLLEDPGGETA